MFAITDCATNLKGSLKALPQVIHRLCASLRYCYDVKHLKCYSGLSANLTYQLNHLLSCPQMQSQDYLFSDSSFHFDEDLSSMILIYRVWYGAINWRLCSLIYFQCIHCSNFVMVACVLVLLCSKCC